VPEEELGFGDRDATDETLEAVYAEAVSGGIDEGREWKQDTSAWTS
jgi:hypothetical protein